ncbi:MAG: MrpF/PhaF family protein [Actinomycetaceae bacterium]|nr:MrpF/PhaF family protein [Actinomycetaceae bacterium]
MSLLQGAYILAGMAMVATIGLSLVRLALGPSVYDRANASDVIAVAVIGLSAMLGAVNGRSDVQIITVILTLIGFLYAVTIGRFTGRMSASRSIMTEDEAKAEKAKMEREAHSQMYAEERAQLREEE